MPVADISEITKTNQMFTRLEEHIAVSEDPKQITRLVKRGSENAVKALQAGTMTVQEAALILHSLGNVVADNVLSTPGNFQVIDTTLTNLLTTSKWKGDDYLGAVAYGLAEKFLWSAMFNSEKLRNRLRHNAWGWRELRGGIIYERMRIRLGD